MKWGSHICWPGSSRYSARNNTIWLHHFPYTFVWLHLYLKDVGVKILTVYGYKEIDRFTRYPTSIHTFHTPIKVVNEMSFVQNCSYSDYIIPFFQIVFEKSFDKRRTYWIHSHDWIRKQTMDFNGKHGKHITQDTVAKLRVKVGSWDSVFTKKW